MDLTQKNIGIWGFGVVGKSLLTFLSSENNRITVMDNRDLDYKEMALLCKHRAHYWKQSYDIESFLDQQDIIFVAPGIDIREYRHYHHKVIAELDLFYHFFKKPIIAITGTLGKTTVATLIATMLSSHGFHVALGGNIGVGLADILRNQHEYDVAVIEASSFQLEYCKKFAPDIAVWTNFFPNHLDRHKTMHDYFNAKRTMFMHQIKNQYAILGNNIAHQLTSHLQSQIISLENVYIKQNQICLEHKSTSHVVATASTLPSCTENIFASVAAVHVFNPSITWKLPEGFTTLAHRMEYIGTIHDISFYNDSKSTVPQATLAALNMIEKQPILLFLGGLSKGIDRAQLIRALSKQVKHVFCFGKEADLLHTLCNQYTISSSKHNTLEDAFNFCVELIKPGDAVLLSPAGSSFDLFKNYEQRGNRFKELVREYIQNEEKNISI